MKRKWDSGVPWDAVVVQGGGLQDNPGEWFRVVFGISPTNSQLAFIRAMLNRRAELDSKARQR